MREISMREIGYSILLRWKTVLSIVIVCLIGLIIFQVINIKANTDELTSKEKLEIQQEIENKVLSKEELQQVEECYEAYQNAKAAVQYRDKAIIMQIDPFHVNTVVNEYVITCRDYKDIQTIKNSYAYFISSGVVGERIGKGDIDISGLVTPVSEQEDMPAIVLEGEAETTLLVEVIHQSEKEALALAKEVDAGIMEYCEELNKKLGKHTITNVMQEAVVESHNTLINWQSQMRAAANNEQNNYDIKKNSLSSEQLKYFESKYLGKESTDDVEQSEDVDKVKNESEDNSKDEGFSIAILFLDIIVALLIAFLYCIISYMLSGKINYTHALQKSYGLRIFGIIPAFLTEEKESMRKRMNSKMFNIAENQHIGKVLEANGNNIKYYVKKQDVDAIYFDIMHGVSLEHVQTIIESLEKNDLKCILSTEFENEYEKIEKIREIGNVILVNQSGKTTYKELENKIELCEENDIAILGVLLEV